MNTLLNNGQPFLGTEISDLRLSSRDLHYLTQSGEIRRMLRGVYIDSRAGDTRDLRAAALHLVKPEQAVFYGATVAYLLGLDVFPPKERHNFKPQCVVPHGTGRVRRELVRCREGYLPDEDLMMFRGLVMTTPVRAAADMLRSLRRPHALAAVDAMAHKELVSREEVMAYIRPIKRFPGIIQARALAPLVEPKTESVGESWTRLILVDAGLPVPLAQYEVFDHHGLLIARLDHAYDEAKIGIEYDGKEFHSGELAVAHDLKRRSFLTDILDWRLAVVTAEDIFGHGARFEEQVAAWLGLTARPRGW